MRRPGGYFQSVGVFGVEEADTFTCAHCNAVKIVKPKERPEDLGGLCKHCMGLLCNRPKCHRGCTPFEKKLERMEARDRALRSYGL